MASPSPIPGSLSPTSPSPSSSAIPIIRPGKSILKKPPPPQRSFFSLSTLSKLLPSSPNVASSPVLGNGPSTSNPKDAPLKRAHFILPQMSTVYPILSSNPPHTPNIKEEKRNIELKEAERRRKIVRSSSSTSIITTGDKDEEDWWSMDKVETFYKECCAGREEFANPVVSAALRHASTTSPRALDLSGIQLLPHAASALADILSIEWGLRKLVLRECDLTHMTLKPVLHALLVTNSLLFFSVASNRNMRLPAFRLIGAYITSSSTVQYLDLSQNALEKKAVEYIVSALGTAPPQSSDNASPPHTPTQAEHHTSSSSSNSSSPLLSLRLDDCSLKQASLETLAQTIRTSSLRNISLRHNRINATGAVALALMIKDYPDIIPSAFSTVTTTTSSSTPATSTSAQQQSAPSHPPYRSSAATLHNPPPARRGPASLAPPPRHPTVASHPPSASPQTTYTPYIPKARRNVAGAAGRSPLSSSSTPSTATPTSATTQAHAHTATQQQHQHQHQNQTTRTASIISSASSATSSTVAPPSPTGSTSTLVDSADTVPIITSSAQGGITTRHLPPALRLGTAGTGASHISTPTRSISGSYDPLQQPSATLLDKVRALDNLPRLGALRTLDLKGNDIRTGTVYIAQVLKRNRTLKILNLSENKIDATGLTQIAESLKYNSCLETLDLSKNPCCGPSLEGIQHLRTAFTLNTSLKRLFLSGTSLTSAGAIMLAEFLPEAQALLHLDLTLNSALDHAGILALSVGIKKNFVIRCLDLNIEPGNEETARLCREILSVCIRNTEEAARVASVAAADEKCEGVDGMGSAGAKSGTTRAKGVWSMIEESELAKSVHSADDAARKSNKSDASADADTDVLVQAVECKLQLEEVLERLRSSSKPADSQTEKPKLTVTIPSTSTNDADDETLTRSKLVLQLLVSLIQSTTTDPDLDTRKMEEMLVLNDDLSLLIRDVEAVLISGTPSISRSRRNSAASATSTNTLGLENGHAQLQEFTETPPDEEETPPTTPKLDKGKGKAPPESQESSPVLQKLIMGSSFSITDSDDEDDEEKLRRAEIEEELLKLQAQGVEIVSPTVDRHVSRILLEEEGEIFRKGQALLSEAEMDSEYAGEELRQGLLEAQVERPPARQLLEPETGFDENHLMVEGETDTHSTSTVTITEPLRSPTSPTPLSPRTYLVRQRSNGSDVSKDPQQMAPRKTTTDNAAAVEPTRRSSRIAEKPKSVIEKKPAAKPRAKAASGASKKREAEDNAENDDDKDGEDTKRQSKKAKPDTPPKEEQSENGEEQDELADDQDDDIPEAPKPIELGDSLPSITLKNEKDEDVDVAQLAAEKGLVLFLIPKADTPGCTQQACGFRDNYKEFEEFNVDVYCVSADAPSAIAKWQSKKSLPYSLLSDRERKLINVLGAGENNKTKRSHFIFEKGGKLVERKIPVKPVDSPKLALEFVKQNLKKEEA